MAIVRYYIPVATLERYRRAYKKAAATVLHNGVVIHHRYEFAGATDGISREVPWKKLAKHTRHEPEAFISLQDHNNSVQFRNVWIRELGDYQ